MSTTAKALTNDALARVEADLHRLTHPEDRADYVRALRGLLSLSMSAAKASPHDKHTSAATS